VPRRYLVLLTSLDPHSATLRFRPLQRKREQRA
jgi:hypothetical protein